MNYFSIFGLPIHYQIDIQRLYSVFQDLQRKYHPDKFVTDTKEKQLSAVRLSAMINQAWEVLRNPIMRAEHLLSLHGFNLDSKKQTIQDMTFIIEQFKLREELDDIKKMQDKDRLNLFINHITEMYNTHHTNMVAQFNNEKWELAADTVCKLRFLNSLRSDVEKIEETLLYF